MTHPTVVRVSPDAVASILPGYVQFIRDTGSFQIQIPGDEVSVETAKALWEAFQTGFRQGVNVGQQTTRKEIRRVLGL